MMKKTDTLPCEVVRDLLPLYLENLTGAETREMIDRHLTDCSECTQYVNLMKEGEASASEAEEEDRREIDYLKQIRRKSRRKYVISLLCIFLVLVMGSLHFIAGPSETKQMEQALMAAELVATRELNDVVNVVTGPGVASTSLSAEAKETKINTYYEKVDRYFAGQLNAVYKDTFQNLLNRENQDIPMDSVIDRRMKTDRVSFAHYEGSRNCANLTNRRQIMELAVTHDWLEHDENGGLTGCYRVRFTCSHLKEHTQMVRDEGNWKVLQFDYEPVEIEPAEQYQLRIFGEETVSRIRQTTQKQFDTFEEARAEAEQLRKLVFNDKNF